MDKVRILILGDNGHFRQTLRENLQMSFPEVAIDKAKDGVETWERVQAFYPDLILMDLRLPGEGGLKLTQKNQGRLLSWSDPLTESETVTKRITGYDSGLLLQGLWGPLWRQGAFIRQENNPWTMPEAL